VVDVLTHLQHFEKKHKVVSAHTTQGKATGLRAAWWTSSVGTACHVLIHRYATSGTGCTVYMTAAAAALSSHKYAHVTPQHKRFQTNHKDEVHRAAMLCSTFVFTVPVQNKVNTHALHSTA
jgi:hypothetical protein